MKIDFWEAFIHCRYVGVTLGPYDKHATDEYDKIKELAKVFIRNYSYVLDLN